MRPLPLLPNFFPSSAPTYSTSSINPLSHTAQAESIDYDRVTALETDHTETSTHFNRGRAQRSVIEFDLDRIEVMEVYDETGRAISSQAFAMQSFLLAKSYDLNSTVHKDTNILQHRMSLQIIRATLGYIGIERWIGAKHTNSLLAHEAAAEAHRKAAVEYQARLSSSTNSTASNEIEQLYAILVELHMTLSVRHNQRSAYHSGTPSLITTASGTEWLNHET